MRKLLFAASMLLVATPAYAMRQFATKGSDQASALIPYVSDTVYDLSLAAGTAQSVTWPAGANYAILTGPGSYWVGSSGHTAVVPSGAVTDGTGSILNPGQLARFTDTTFSIISASSQIISVAFYQ